MSTRIRPRLTYANVMSTIAVFGVLGGGAYAAQKITAKDIARNAIRAKHIQRGAVKGPKIAKGAVTAAKLAPGVAISGPRGLPGEPGADGTARAYARVNPKLPRRHLPLRPGEGNRLG